MINIFCEDTVIFNTSWVLGVTEYVTLYVIGKMLPKDFFTRYFKIGFRYIFLSFSCHNPFTDRLMRLISKLMETEKWRYIFYLNELCDEHVDISVK